VVLFGSACSDDDSCSPEEATEVGGPQCCSKGCGNSGDGWLPRVCKDGQWVCESNGVLEDACAYPLTACTPMVGCHDVGQGIGETEPDPAPELCCELSCDGTKAVHRVCNTGILWECPAGAVPISRCKDYRSACGGILAKYKANGYKLP
jgi:hypothetical protein